ncbi:MAG TPA: MFS transporter [Actinomycetota bacterium]
MAGGAASVVLTVLRDRALRRIELAYLGFSMAEYATWVAILVYAFERGGATAAGVVSVIQLVPSALVAPVAAAYGDRYRRDRFLWSGYLAQAVTMGATGALMVWGAPAAAVYAAAVTAAVTITFTRPAQGSLVPLLVAGPEELVAVNAVSGAIESASFVGGPALAALLMAVSEPGSVFLAMALLAATSALLVTGLSIPGGAASIPEEDAAATTLRRSFSGFGRLAGQPDARLLVGLVSSQSLVIGALDVLAVVVAISLLGLGTAAPGLLTAAIGVGGLLGTAAGFSLVTRRRLSPALALGAVVLGAPLAVIAWRPETAVAFVMLAVAGVGRVVMDVSGRSLLQRAVSADLLARAFGVLEGLEMAALAVGSILASGVVAWLGGRGALLVVGLLLPVVVGVCWRSLRRIESRAAPPSGVMELLRRVPIFAPLPPLALERLATSAGERGTPAGGTILREGRPGDDFHVIARGHVRVVRGPEVLNDLGEGDSFGEISLVRDVPRTASVIAVTDVLTFTLSREDFLRALSGNPASAVAARRIVEERAPEPAPDRADG